MSSVKIDARRSQRSLMKKKLKKKKRSAAARIGEAATAAAGGVLASLASGDQNVLHAAAWGASAAAPSLWNSTWDYVGEKYHQWQNERRQKFLKAFAGNDGSVDGLRLLTELGDTEWSKNAIFAALRHVNEAIDDAVIPALGRLLREYLGCGKRIDWYFRGVQRVLSDLTPEEFEQLKIFLDYVFNLRLDDVDTFTAVFDQKVRSDVVSIQGIDDVKGGPSLSESRRLFHLIRTHGLATGGGDPESQVLKMRVDTMQRLAQLVCVETPLV